MLRISAFLRKLVTAAAVLAIAVLAWPAASASAAAAADEGNPPGRGRGPGARLELAWSRAQRAYEQQGSRLERAGDLIADVQDLIDEAERDGRDASDLQAALDAFAAGLPAARSAHAAGEAVIAGHAGFDSGGRVIDRATALETVRALREIIAQTHQALDGTGRALCAALRDLRQAQLRAEDPAE
jgi:hypothetical protein